MGRRGAKSVAKFIYYIDVQINENTDVDIDVNIFPGTGENDLTGVSFPCTISGLRAMGSFYGTFDTQTGNAIRHFWCVYHLRQGELPAQAVFTSGSTIFAPEQDVMIWGTATTISQINDAPSTSNNIVVRNYDVVGTTKRKLQIGDGLHCYIIVEADATFADTLIAKMVFQFFVLV